jgi:hypothetical protein
MDQRIYHGKVTPSDLAQSLIAHFNRGNLRVQQFGDAQKTGVQIATAQNTSAGGRTALTITINKVEDGVIVQVGQQAWMGVAASLGLSALAALRNPWLILDRLDDIAQDVEYIQLSEEVWKVLDGYARALGSGFELSDRLKRMVCEFCNTANPIGESACIACGAPLGDSQPSTCKRCGFVTTRAERACPNCGSQL